MSIADLIYPGDGANVMTINDCDVYVYVDGHLATREDPEENVFVSIVDSNLKVKIDIELIEVVATFVEEFKTNVAIKNQQILAVEKMPADAEIFCGRMPAWTIYFEVCSKKFRDDYDEVKMKLKKLLALNA